MIVICKKETKRIVKGLRYKVKSIWNSGSNARWLEGKLELEGVDGRLSCKNFTDANGNDLPKIDILSKREVIDRPKFEHLKAGDILVCTSDEYKTLIKDAMYKIEKVESISKDRKYSIQKIVYTENFIKFEGIERRLKWSSWRFRRLTPDESREMSLNSILNEGGDNIIKTSKLRKIDHSPNKLLTLMQILSKSVIDPNRHQLSVVDWACKKIGVNLSINNTDYSELLEMPLKDILQKIDNNN